MYAKWNTNKKSTTNNTEVIILRVPLAVHLFPHNVFLGYWIDGKINTNLVKKNYANKKLHVATNGRITSTNVFSPDVSPCYRKI